MCDDSYSLLLIMIMMHLIHESLLSDMSVPRVPSVQNKANVYLQPTKQLVHHAIFEVSTGLFGRGSGFTIKRNVSAAPLAAIFSGIQVYLIRGVKHLSLIHILYL